MLVNTYPERDPATIFSLSPLARRFAVVVDADELLREVRYRSRNEREPLILSLEQSRFATLFATERVGEEVEANLDRFCAADPAGAWETWERDYRPAIRWVGVPDRTRVGFGADEAGFAERVGRVIGAHAADAPTAELALLCAPCFVLTGNRKHLQSAGFGDAATRKALVAAADKAELELAGLAAAGFSELTTIEGARLAGRLARKAADSPLLSGALLAAVLLGAHLAYQRREDLRQAGKRGLRGSLRMAELIAQRHRQLLATLLPSLVLQPDPPTRASFLARALMRSRRPLAAQAIGESLGLSREAVLVELRDHPAFRFWPGQGWSLGYHLG